MAQNICFFCRDTAPILVLIGREVRPSETPGALEAIYNLWSATVDELLDLIAFAINSGYLLFPSTHMCAIPTITSPAPVAAFLVKYCGPNIVQPFIPSFLHSARSNDTP